MLTIRNFEWVLTLGDRIALLRRPWPSEARPVKVGDMSSLPSPAGQYTHHLSFADWHVTGVTGMLLTAEDALAVERHMSGQAPTEASEVDPISDASVAVLAL